MIPADDQWSEELTELELDALRIAAELTLRLQWGRRAKIHKVETALRSALVKIDRLLWVVDQHARKAQSESANDPQGLIEACR